MLISSLVLGSDGMCEYGWFLCRARTDETHQKGVDYFVSNSIRKRIGIVFIFVVGFGFVSKSTTL